MTVAKHMLSIRTKIDSNAKYCYHAVPKYHSAKIPSVTLSNKCSSTSQVLKISDSVTDRKLGVYV